MWVALHFMPADDVIMLYSSLLYQHVCAFSAVELPKVSIIGSLVCKYSSWLHFSSKTYFFLYQTEQVLALPTIQNVMSP
jgi:hypothetical protein